MAVPSWELTEEGTRKSQSRLLRGVRRTSVRPGRPRGGALGQTSVSAPPAAGHRVLGQEEPSWLGRPALDAPQMGNEPGEAVACPPPSLSAATVRDGSACEARPRVSLCSRLLSGRLWSASCVLEKAPVPTEPLAWTSARVIRGRRREVSRSPRRAHRVPPQPDSEEART